MPEPRSLTIPRDVKAFKKWLAKAGAEVLPTKGEYEALRFRGNGGVLSLVHRSIKGRISYQGEARPAFEAFAAGAQYEFAAAEDLPPVLHEIGPDSGRIVLDMADEKPVTMAAVMDRLRVTARAAHAFLTAEAAAGRLVRSGGGPGQPMQWSAVAVGGREAA